MVRVWYNYINVGFKHESPKGLVVGLLASAGRGSSPPTCIVLYCIVCWAQLLLATFEDWPSELETAVVPRPKVLQLCLVSRTASCIVGK